MPIATSGLYHLHLIVKDLERSLAFYRKVFGFTVKFRVGADMAFIGGAGGTELITLNQDRRGRARIGKGGVDHFGFRTVGKTSPERIIALVTKAGGTLMKRGEHAPGQPFLYVADPDGYVIEF
jgi:catechol 2,3-dioxygenase-like lactoylglutathione lyase family enzyme